MNPLCTLRYSATHVDKHHMVFRLDAVDAYERKLVKQIEVASARSRGRAQQGLCAARLGQQRQGYDHRAGSSIDVQEGKAWSAEMHVQDGDDLEELTGRAIYDDCRIGEIRAAKRQRSSMELSCPAARLPRPGEAMGDVDCAGRASG